MSLELGGAEQSLPSSSLASSLSSLRVFDWSLVFPGLRVFARLRGFPHDRANDAIVCCLSEVGFIRSERDKRVPSDESGKKMAQQKQFERRATANEYSKGMNEVNGPKKTLKLKPIFKLGFSHHYYGFGV